MFYKHLSRKKCIREHEFHLIIDHRQGSVDAMVVTTKMFFSREWIASTQCRCSLHVCDQISLLAFYVCCRYIGIEFTVLL